VRELQETVRAVRAGQDLDLGAMAESGNGASTFVSSDASARDASLDASEDPEGEDRVLRCVSMPRWLRACFEETLALHRAVNGFDTTVASFVEALAAEAAAGAHPPDVTSTPLRTGIPTAVVEAALARVNNRWAELRASTEEIERTDAAAEGLSRSMMPDSSLGAHSDGPRDAATTQPPGDSNRARAALELAKRFRFILHVEDCVERELTALLLEMSRRGDWTTLGFASAAHYASERLGLPRRNIQSRIAVARKLGRLSRVQTVYREGRIEREKAALLERLLPPHASVELQELWLARAAETTIKRLRDELRMVELGDLGESSGSIAGGRPPTDAEWHASLRREPGRTRRRLARC